MKCAVVVFPGSNCDSDVYHALADDLNLDTHYVWHGDSNLQGYDLIVLPGGFSYGDYLRCGAIARFSPVMQAVRDFASKGGLVLGICNGFQILVEASLLPGALLKNDHLQFRCEWASVRVENAQTPFSSRCREGQVLSLPIAHGEGCYYADDETLVEWEEEGRVVFRYSLPGGEVTSGANPNGSLNNIAGITNKRGNVLGMMPHPERAANSLLGATDGTLILGSVVDYVKAGGR